MKTYIAASALLVIIFISITVFLNRRSENLITVIRTHRAKENALNTLNEMIGQAKADLQDIDRDKIKITLPSPEEAEAYIRATSASAQTEITGDIATSKPNDNQTLAVFEATAPSEQSAIEFLHRLETERYIIEITKADIQSSPDGKTTLSISIQFTKP